MAKNVLRMSHETIGLGPQKGEIIIYSYFSYVITNTLLAYEDSFI